MKKAPKIKKKVPGYVLGGNLAVTTTKNPNFVEKKPTDNSFEGTAKDVVLFAGDTALSQWAPNLIKQTDYSGSKVGKSLGTVETVNESFSSASPQMKYLAPLYGQGTSTDPKVTGYDESQQKLDETIKPIANVGAGIGESYTTKAFVPSKGKKERDAKAPVGDENGIDPKTGNIVDNSVSGTPVLQQSATENTEASKADREAWWKTRSYKKGGMVKLNPQMKKGGGVVEGKGTGTSDSNHATLEKNDFIIPARSAKSPIVKKMLINIGLNKTAPLKDGNVPIKISNGEVIVPKEYKPMANSFLSKRGLSLNNLAPNAKGGQAKEDGGTVDTTNPDKKFNLDAGTILSGVQLGVGAYNASKLGKVPVDSIDPQYLEVGNRLNEASQYGLSPLETNLAAKRIEQVRRASIKNVMANAGHDAGTTLGNIQASGLNADDANADLAISSEKLKNAKLNTYANWANSKAGMSRQLFEDKLSRFNKSENVNGALINSGVTNLLGQQRLSDVKAAADKRAKIEAASPYMSKTQFTQAGIKALADLNHQTPAEYMATQKVYDGVDYNALPKS